ncbi:MAG: hypothetical protein H6550_04105 [Chitinophagales bacterium]|nr:hypothetical protein [Chitinophagales bacterium]
MSVKRKISVRKIIQALLTLVFTGVCITAVMSATKLYRSRTLKDVDIQIKNDEHGFVTREQVRAMLLRDGEIKEESTKLSQLNVQQMERVITANPWVEDAQVYIDNKQKLHALVTQRVPVVRIFEKEGNSYYLDSKQEQLPLSTQYNYYTMVVTNVPELKNDSAGDALKNRIMSLVKFIRQDTFWNAQVSQVIVRDDLGFEIVPVLGEQQVIIGDTTDMKLKFDNLFAFYNKVLNEVGWDKYQVLDLSFKGQLVASPAINWKMPVDKVINRINWVNSILGENAKPPVVNRTVAATPPPAAKPDTLAIAPVQAQQVETPKQPEPKKTEQVKPVEGPVKKQAEPKQPVIEKEKQQEDKKPKYIYNGG